MICSRWDEKEFVKFCQDGLSPREQAKMQSHLDGCKICRDKFISAWQVLIDEKITVSDVDAIEQILASPRWQARRQEMARKNAQTIKQQLQTRRPAVRSINPSPRTWLMVAAMLIALVLPAGFTYLYLYQSSKDSIDLTQFTDINATDPIALATAFEKISNTIEAEPENRELYFYRAQILEKLYLFEAAQQDYQKYLSTVDISHSDAANRQLAQLNERLTNPPQPTPNRYELLDKYINDYLSAKSQQDQTGLTTTRQNMQVIANEMQAKTGEMIGTDLYEYYQQVEPEQADTLLKARLTRAKYEKFGSVDNFSAALADISSAKETFNKFGAVPEIELTDIQLAKFLSRSGDQVNAEKLVEQHLTKSVKANHQFAQANLILRIGEIKGELSQFEESRAAIKKSITIAESLEVPDFIITPTTLLSGVYFFSNRDQFAFEQAFKGIAACDKAKQESPKIYNSQILGVSAFNLQFTKLSEYFLKDSISQSNKQGKSPYTTLSYAFLAITRAEQQLHKQAESDFNIAVSTLNQIADKKSRENLAITIYGYQARAKALAGDLEPARQLYEKTLELGKRNNLSQKLYLSQLHQGYGECLARLGNKDRAETEFQLAVNYAREARVGLEESNTLLTFAVSRETPEELLKTLND